jgi:hypothetical protein
VTTHRRYYFVHEGPWTVPGGHARILEELQDQCNRNWWYNNPEVHGEALGLLEFRVTVSGEEQWRVHKRAMALAITCYHICGLGPDLVPTPMWEPLPPHSNRGYSRLL